MLWLISLAVVLALVPDLALAQDLTDGEIAGIAIGAVAGFVIIVILLLCCCYMFLIPQEPTPPIQPQIPPPVVCPPQQPPLVINQPPIAQSSWYSKFPGYNNFSNSFGNSWYGGRSASPYDSSYSLGQLTRDQPALGYY